MYIQQQPFAVQRSAYPGAGRIVRMREGLGDVERMWQLRASEPVAQAEIAQRILSGEQEITLPDTPENRIAVASQFVAQAEQYMGQVERDAGAGIQYTHDAPVTQSPQDTSDYSMAQARAEVIYASNLLHSVRADAPATISELQQSFANASEQQTQQFEQQLQQSQNTWQSQLDFQASESARMLREQQAAQQAMIVAAEQNQQRALAEQQLAQKRAIAEQDAANARALADRQAAQGKAAADAKAAFDAQMAALAKQQAAALAASQQASNEVDYSKAYNAALATAEAMRKLQANASQQSASASLPQNYLTDSGGYEYSGGISQPGGGGTKSAQGFSAVTSEANPNWILWIGAALVGYFALK